MAAVLPLSASTIIFATGPQQVGGYEINVKATFDFDYTAQTVTISLLNLELNPTDIAQTLGSLRFDIAGATATPTYVSSSIGTFDIDNLGRPKADNKPNSWSATNIGGNTIGFCAVCAAGGVGVAGLVIGGPDSNLRYSNDDGTLKNRSKPEPFIIGSGAIYTSSALQSLDTSPSWVYKLPNMTPNVMVSNVFLGFGESAAYGASSYFMANYTEYDIPEPGSLVLTIAGLGMVAATPKYLHSRR
uniref:PEP-CTERM protein-sorting domain-containing protein n=1 Tax=Solibacter usitatus (strain Ellin6076) TaxID=234267 RepID=Q020T9_SOLUE